MASEGTRFKIGHAAGPDWRAATDACLAAIGAPDREDNIGFVYFTDHLAGDAAAIRRRLAERTGISAWFGTTGIGVCATGREYFDEPAVVAMTGRLPADAFTIVQADGGGEWTSAKGYFGVVHGDPRDQSLPSMLAAIAEASGSFVVGGLSASRGAQPQIAGEVHDGGLSGVLFSDQVPVVTGLTQGCTPIGPAHEVTASEGNVAIKLDGRPAFEVFVEEIGEVLARDLNRVAGYIFAALPVTGVDRPDYLVRNIMSVDPQAGMVAIAAPLAVGEMVMFCRRDAETARRDLDRMLDDLKRRAGVAVPRAALYFSCLARGPNMFGEDSAELKAIQSSLGDVPLAGFFCNGEISNARLYTYTGVLSLIL